jgi:hypothetical protein
MQSMSSEGSLPIVLIASPTNTLHDLLTEINCKTDFMASCKTDFIWQVERNDPTDDSGNYKNRYDDVRLPRDSR